METKRIRENQGGREGNEKGKEKEEEKGNLKVHKIENFFGSEFEFYTISLLVMLKY
jgi:hypothetical protein